MHIWFLCHGPSTEQVEHPIEKWLPILYHPSGLTRPSGMQIKADNEMDILLMKLIEKSSELLVMKMWRIKRAPERLHLMQLPRYQGRL